MTRFPEYGKDKVRSPLELLGKPGDFLSRTLIAHTLRPTVNKQDFIKLNGST